MSITPDTIAAIQHAGQALDTARAALQQASQQQSQAAQAGKIDTYNRAIAACMEGRGYAVK